MADMDIAPEWRACKRFPDYEVDAQGHVRRIRDQHPIPKFPNSCGYLYVSIRAGFKENRKVCVHRLVAEAHVEGQADGLEVNHINRVRADNRAENLEWVTHRQNMASAKGAGRPTKSGRLVTDEDAMEMHRLRAAGMRQKDIAALFQVSPPTVSHTITGRQRPRIYAQAREELGPRWHGSCR